MADESASPPKIDYRRPVGFALLGFGVPTMAAGALLYRLVFLSRRGPTIAQMSPGNSYGAAGGILLVIGLMLTIAGFWLANAAPSRPDAKASRAPLDFRDRI